MQAVTHSLFSVAAKACLRGKILKIRGVFMKLIDVIMQHLGVEEEERFNIIDNNGQLEAWSPYYFKDGVLLDKDDDDTCALDNIVSGFYTIEKIPPITKEEAYTKIVELIKEYNQGWVPDWNDNDKTKMSFCYIHSTHKLTFRHIDIFQDVPDELCFRYTKEVEEFIEQLEPFCKIYLGVKN